MRYALPAQRSVTHVKVFPLCQSGQKRGRRLPLKLSVEAISHERVRQALKNAVSPHLRPMWAFPRAEWGLCGALGKYLGGLSSALCAQVPPVCMDAQPVQLIKEVSKPVPAAQRRPERYDDSPC